LLSAVACYVSIFAFAFAAETAPRPIRSDGWSYYVYLPSWVIYHDTTLHEVARRCCGGRFPTWTAIDHWPSTGAWVNAHPIGVAILMLPFFLVAHAVTPLARLPRDGFSFYYQHAAGLSAIPYLVLGLWCLKRVLLRRFSAGVTLATLACITWGTNLFHYGVFDGTFSHVYAFCLIAALLDVLPRWLDDPTTGRSVLMGTLAGLLVLVRHQHVVVLAGLACYGLTNLTSMRTRAAWIGSRWRDVAFAGCVMALWLAPQAFVYYQATGHVFVDAYGADRHFNFASPHLVAVLLGTEKGLFFWSPVLLTSLAGFFMLRRVMPELIAPLLIILPINVYLVASWFDWQFGASFGHRAFTDLLPFFAIGMAACFDRIRQTRLVMPVTVLASAAVALSLAQMVQYWIGVLPMSDTTWKMYTAVFLKFTR
jgi:hypothetical protein